MTIATFGHSKEINTGLSANNNYFIENKGQWESNILFFTQTNGMFVWVTTDALVFDFYSIQLLPRSAGFKPIGPKDPVDSPIINGHVVKMKIQNKNQHIYAKQEIITGQALEQYNNYFKGNDPGHWASNVRLFNSVTIKNYVPGLDLRLYFDQGKFRYDLITQPEVNPNNISLRFEGQNGLLLNNQHELVLKTSIGDISHGGLNIYQNIKGQQTLINSAFKKISDNDIGFDLKNYDPSYPVIIDPIIFSTLLGANSLEYGLDVEVDASENAIVGGITYSASFPTSNGAYDRYANGSYDVFITKFNSNGTSLIYSTFIGGNNVDYFYSLDIDNNGNCYFTGYTSSNNYPTTSGCFDSTLSGTYYDVMVTKLNPSGTNLVYSTYIGGTYGNVGTDIVVDASNSAYVCGYAYVGYPTTSGAFRQYITGSWDGFVTKLNSSGSGLIYSTLLGGSNVDYCNAITVDDSGFVYVAGYTASTNFPIITGCYQTSLNSGQDAFITKINTNGSALVYSTYLGGNSSIEQATDIAVNSSGNACIAGNTNATNFAVTGGTNAYQIANNGISDGFVTILNTTGTAISYSTYIGGNLQDNLTHIAIDEENNIVITGTTQSTNYPTTICALQSSASAFSDIILSVLNPTLSTLLYSTYLGGNGGEYGTGLSINTNNEGYITGYTYSSNYPTTTGAYQRTYFGGYDAVLTKFPILILKMDEDVEETYCAGANFTMPFIAGCVFVTGNSFTVQLSNSSGSFASPIALGTISSQTSGTINCYLPKNTTPGSGYRIRLVSSNPFYTTLDNGFNIRINASPIVQFTLNGSTQCLGNNFFQFTNSSTIPTGGLTYFWKFGDTTYSTQTSPTHHYLNDTNYFVKLIVTSDSGCSDSLSKAITINLSPETNFSVNDSFQCLANNLYSFSSSTILSKGTYNVLWNFGDGDTSTKSNPKHSYKTNSNFVVKLTAITNFGCKDSAVKIMKILPEPLAAFTINDTGQCLNYNNFIFTNTTSITKGTSSSIWLFGDGVTTTATKPSHIYTTAKNYTVKLITTSDSGCIDSAKQTIGLAPLPVAGFSINATPQCLNGNLFSFTNNSTTVSGTLKYNWDFGNSSTDTLKNPSYSYNSDGIYTVTLVATASIDCADTVQKQLVINPSPKSSYSINDTDQCFKGNNFIFTNTSTIKSGNLTYIWNLGDATTTNSTNTSHSYLVDKGYQVKLVSTSNLGCKDSIIKNIVVYSTPKASYFVNDTGQCVDRNSFSFTNTSNINNGTLKFRWYYGDTKTDTLRNPTHIYSKYGNYNVRLIATSNKNCPDTFNGMVNVYPLPKAAFIIYNPMQCLTGNNFICNNTSTIPTGSMTYRWTFGDGFQSTNTDTNHTYLNAGIYNIKLYSTSSFGCSDTAISKVTLLIMPTANYNVSTICLGEPVNFTDRSFINNPDFITQWIWDFDDGSVSTDQNPSYTFINNGTFGVRLIVVSNNGCRDSIMKPLFVRPHISAPLLNKASVMDDASDIEIEWSPSSGSFIQNYILEKSEDNLTFSTLSHPDRQATRYIDYSVLPDSMSYYYRIKAVDSCNFISNNSNYGKSILLRTTNTTHIAELKWTAYEEWSEGINHYEVEVFNNNISNFINVATVDGYTLKYNDDVTALNQSDYCYRVIAVRNIDGVIVYSNSSCVSVSFGCFLPNSFTPNGDELNDVLLAVGTFVLKFNISVFDRWGNMEFQSNDMNIGWDGKHNGVNVPEGYYYYQFTARGIKNQKITRKGSILLIR